MTGFNLATYTLQIFGPEDETLSWSPSGPRSSHDDTDKRLLADLPAIMESVEEDLTDLLPEGYRAVVKVWDK